MEGYGNFWKYFGEDRYNSKPWYGGSYKNNLGHYDLLSENGQDFLVLYMSWDIYTDEINWMNQVLAQYPKPQGHHLLASLHQREANGCGLLDYHRQAFARRSCGEESERVRGAQRPLTTGLPSRRAPSTMTATA